MPRAARAVILGLFACASLGSCGEPPAAPEQQVLGRVASGDFPSRYSFQAEPRVETPVDCLLASPRFSGQVDVPTGRMQVEVTAPIRGKVVVDDGTAFVDAALLGRDLGGRWLRLDEQTTDAVAAAARDALGPLLDPYIDPPALPADPNSIVTEAAEKATSIEWLGSRTEAGRTLDGIRLILDRDVLTTTNSQLATTTHSTPAVDPVVEAWADAEGIVRDLIVGHLSGTEVTGGYTTTYTESPAVVIEMPVRPWIGEAELLAAPATPRSCELSVGS